MGENVGVATVVEYMMEGNFVESYRKKMSMLMLGKKSNLDVCIFSILNQNQKLMLFEPFLSTEQKQANISINEIL